jgi:hypothetical protein
MRDAQAAAWWLSGVSRVPRVVRRTGVVQAVGRAVADDGGLFHPLGLTFMWAVYGEKFERDRYLAHLEFLAPYQFDYLRILAEVSWAGETIDPSWPDYEAQLGATIDDAYELGGLRTEITIFGSAKDIPNNPMDVAAAVARVINAGRQEKVIAVEVANESFQNGPSIDVLIQVAKYLRATIPNLVALSSPGGPQSVFDEMKAAALTAGATLVTLHTDRSGGDHKWRQVRQGWDFKDFSQVADSNEPPGPESSVDTNNSPLQLAMMRATSVLSGAALYVLHVGDMVGGRIDPVHQRVANLWEVPNIDTILKAVRGVDPLLPENLENWPKFNNFWPGHPLTTAAFWGDGSPDGVNRNYAASDGTSFIVVADGVKDHMVNTARRAMHVDAYDPLTGGILSSADLAAGQTWDLPGRADTMTAYVIKGIFR